MREACCLSRAHGKRSWCVAACALTAMSWTKNSDGKVRIVLLPFSCSLKRKSARLIKQGGQNLEDPHIAGELHASGQTQDLNLNSQGRWLRTQSPVRDFIHLRGKTESVAWRHLKITEQSPPLEKSVCRLDCRGEHGPLPILRKQRGLGRRRVLFEGFRNRDCVI